MYFGHDRVLDREKVRVAEAKFSSLLDEEKNVYCNELRKFLRQQVYYAGLDHMYGHMVIKSLQEQIQDSLVDLSGIDINCERDIADREEKSDVKIIKGSRSQLQKILKILENSEDRKEEVKTETELN